MLQSGSRTVAAPSSSLSLQVASTAGRTAWQADSGRAGGTVWHLRGWRPPTEPHFPVRRCCRGKGGCTRRRSQGRYRWRDEKSGEGALTRQWRADMLRQERGCEHIELAAASGERTTSDVVREWLRYRTRVPRAGAWSTRGSWPLWCRTPPRCPTRTSRSPEVHA